MGLMFSNTYYWRIWLIAAMAILSGCQEYEVDSAAQPGIEILTDKGPIRGGIRGDTRVFLGIPYAAPPLGTNRWRAPAPVVAWTEVRDASVPGPSCMQKGGGRVGPVSEDCLLINVWTPNQASEKPLPVFVWIHGGGFEVGSSNNPMLNGQNLSEAGNIVVVSLNYRLGTLGFLALADLSAESSSKSSGAYGFLDQVAALQWIKGNIASFNGDPSNITLGGNSAGAMSVCFHLVSDASRGLFQRAIMQSGICTRPTPDLDEYVKQGTKTIAEVGCAGDTDTVNCLRAQDAQLLMDAAALNNTYPGGDLFQPAGTIWELPPTVDNEFLDQPVVRSMASGEMAKVPVIIGANNDEGGFFIYGETVPDDAQGYREALNRRYGPRAQDVLGQYPLDDFDSPVQALAEVLGDELFLCPTLHTAQFLRQAGSDVYLYKFERSLALLGDPWSRAFHTAEIPFVFGNAHFFTELGQADLDYSAKVMPYWLRFIVSGDPNSDDVMQWPAYESDSHLVFAEPMRVAQNFGGPNCAFWKAYFRL